MESRGEGALLRSKRGREGAAGRGAGCRWRTALKAGRGQRLGQARAPWRAASARRLIKLGRGAARRARRRRGDGTRRWRAHHGRPRVGAQQAKRHRRAAAGMPLCSAPWSTACGRSAAPGCRRASVSERGCRRVEGHSWPGSARRDGAASYGRPSAASRKTEEGERRKKEREERESTEV